MATKPQEATYSKMTTACGSLYLIAFILFFMGTSGIMLSIPFVFAAGILLFINFLTSMRDKYVKEKGKIPTIKMLFLSIFFFFFVILSPLVVPYIALATHCNKSSSDCA